MINNPQTIITLFRLNIPFSSSFSSFFLSSFSLSFYFFSFFCSFFLCLSHIRYFNCQKGKKHLTQCIKQNLCEHTYLPRILWPVFYFKQFITCCLLENSIFPFFVFFYSILFFLFLRFWRDDNRVVGVVMIVTTCDSVYRNEDSAIPKNAQYQTEQNMSSRKTDNDLIWTKHAVQLVLY